MHIHIHFHLHVRPLQYMNITHAEGTSPKVAIPAGNANTPDPRLALTKLNVADAILCFLAFSSVVVNETEAETAPDVDGDVYASTEGSNLFVINSDLFSDWVVSLLLLLLLFHEESPSMTVADSSFVEV